MGNFWHVKNWFRVGHNISWKLNFYTLGGFLYLYKPCDFFYSMAEKKHTFVISYLKKEMHDIIEKYKNINEIESASYTPRIWILWWQGKDNAPGLVKACIRSVERNAGSVEVVVITKENIGNYINLPEYILVEKNKGWISFAQLSDIIRFMLLEKYGGLWLDATVFTSKQIPKSYFDFNFFSQHTKWQKTCFVQHNLYHGFIIGSRPNAKLVSFAKEMFLKYWKAHNTLVDYLMIDYILMIAYQEFPDIKEEIDSLPWSSERLYDLVHLLNEPYDGIEAKTLFDDCIFSKLDWHKKYKMKAKGKQTYFSYITSL